MLRSMQKKMLTRNTRCDITYYIDMNASTLPFKIRRAAAGGFSLVEVCLSLGIITVTVMPLLGVLAGSLGQLRSNMDRNQATNISQQLLLEAQQMDFKTLKNKGTYYEYFTEEGDNVNEGNPGIVYTAKITVTDPTSSRSNSAPLQGVTPPAVSTLAALSVTIRKTPHGVDAAANAPLATYVNMVSCDDLSTLTASP